MRRLLGIGVAGALTLLPAAGCGSAARVEPGSTAPATATTSPRPPATRLAFSGAVTGTVESAAPSGTCGRGSGGATGADLRFQMNGTAYALSIEVLGYHGPGSYTLPPDRVSLHTTTIGPGSQFFGSQSGTVTVAAGDAAGTVDADLEGSPGTVHVSGTWSCAG